MAAILCQQDLEAERNSTLYADEGRGQKHSFRDSAHVWHNTFCKMLTENVQKSDLGTLFDNVSFITFNYDRCIEQYIARWLESYMLISRDEAEALTSKLHVIHPYGQVGKLPWQSGMMNPVNFGASVEGYALADIAKNIRTFTEQIDDETVPLRMKRLLAEAQQVVYLGFSFGRMNMELMKLERSNWAKNAYATAMRTSPANKEVIQRELRESMTPESRNYLYSEVLADCTCQELLNDYFRVLTD